MTKLPSTINIDGVQYTRLGGGAPTKPRQIDWSQVVDIVPVKVSRENGLSAMILYPALSDTGYPDTKIWSKRTLITSLWIPWFGGECPLPEGVIVRVVLRDTPKAMDNVNEARSWDWTHESRRSGETVNEVIAFRVTGIAQGWVE